jgi:uncharacterized protein (TIGR02118 family)
MVKLVILIEEMENPSAFDEAWPAFLHLAESMPGLQRETFSRVEAVIFAQNRPAMLHELYFDSLESARLAMASPIGRQAGQLLQQISGGRISLFLADHKEESLDNIRKHISAGKE